VGRGLGRSLHQQSDPGDDRDHRGDHQRAPEARRRAARGAAYPRELAHHALGAVGGYCDFLPELIEQLFEHALVDHGIATSASGAKLASRASAARRRRAS
jgi:hypothetical protein